MLGMNIFAKWHLAYPIMIGKKKLQSCVGLPKQIVPRRMLALDWFLFKFLTQWFPNNACQSFPNSACTGRVPIQSQQTHNTRNHCLGSMCCHCAVSKPLFGVSMLATFEIPVWKQHMHSWNRWPCWHMQALTNYTCKHASFFVVKVTRVLVIALCATIGIGMANLIQQ